MAILCLLTIGASSHAAPQTQWEYCLVAHSSSEQLVIYPPNGGRVKQQGANGEPSEAVRLLTQLGAKGWEVVAATYQGGYSTWTLKRRVTASKGSNTKKRK
jgi:hypothetical protein